VNSKNGKFDFYSLLPEDLLALSDAEWEERDARVATERSRERSIRTEAIAVARKDVLRSGGVSERLADKALGPLEPSTALDHLRDFRPRDRPIRILSGSTGTGKTIAAVWWLAEHGGSRPVFVRASDYELRSRYDEAWESRWRSATGLVIDDLGGEYADRGGSFLSDFERLIDHFTENYAGLVVTTNSTAKELNARYGARIWSRLKGAARFRPINEEDRRGR